MRLAPPRSAAAIRDSPWKQDPSLIHAPCIHVCDRLNQAESYKYMGSMLHRGGSWRPEIWMRGHDQTTALGPLRRAVFGLPDLPPKTRIKYAASLGCSRFLCQAVLWTLPVKTMSRAESKYLDAFRAALKPELLRPPEPKASNEEVMLKAGRPSLSLVLRVRAEMFAANPEE
eukprot:205594-Pyramimonas_sp.AAC.3